MEQTKKQKVLSLIPDLKSDSISKRDAAKKEIISICEPVIKKFYNIAKEFELTYHESCHPSEEYFLKEWDNDYISSRGSIESVCDAKPTSVEFYYSDGMRGNIYEAYIDMPLHWLDDGSDEEYRRFCRAKALMFMDEKIKRAKSKVTELEARYEELKAM